MNIVEFKKLPFMGIMRGIQDSQIEPLVETIVLSGLKTIEITMNTRGAEDLIRKAVKLSNGRLIVGAGTVLTAEDFNQLSTAPSSSRHRPT